MQLKSVQSVHPCKSVVQTTYDTVKAHGGDLKSCWWHGQRNKIYFYLRAIFRKLVLAV